MIKNRYVVGVDGGGSKTVALVATENGKILGRGEAGPSNYHNIGPIAAGRAITKAVREAQSNAGLMKKKPELAVVALAAIDSPIDLKLANGFVRQTGIARKFAVVHDSIAALYASTRGKPGIIVISGTGCVAAGINKNGHYARAGGWGHLIGDEGSAYDIGRKGLNYAFKSLDGMIPTTKLVPIFKRVFHVKHLEDSLEKIYVTGFSVEEIAHLAPRISNAAQYDAVSRQIVSDAGLDLAKLVRAVARRLEMTDDQFSVAIVGGNFRSGMNLLAPFEASIKEECVHARITRLRVEPVKGAVLLGLSMLHEDRKVSNIPVTLAERIP